MHLPMPFTLLTNVQDFVGLFLLLAGFVIGLGAVIVIDVHGLRGRTSSYWSEATIRTHKITKPLIWAGTVLTIIGKILFFWNESTSLPSHILNGIFLILIGNGCFLSFFVSPLLLKKEREGKAKELLPHSLQTYIACSLIVSDIGWWTALAIVVYTLTQT